MWAGSEQAAYDGILKAFGRPGSIIPVKTDWRGRIIHQAIEVRPPSEDEKFIHLDYT